jgi:hypothetical protein
MKQPPGTRTRMYSPRPTASYFRFPQRPAPDCNRFSMGPTVERKRSAWSLNEAPLAAPEGDSSAAGIRD